MCCQEIIFKQLKQFLENNIRDVLIWQRHHIYVQIECFAISSYWPYMVDQYELQTTVKQHSDMVINLLHANCRN